MNEESGAQKITAIQDDRLGTRSPAGIPNDSTPHYYQIHMFMCVNHRDNARSCAGSNSVVLHEYLKKKAREVGLDPLRTLRVNKSGCMGRCEHGPTAVVYPQGVWYHYETREDLDEILHEHLLAGRIVKRLRLPTPPVDR